MILHNLIGGSVHAQKMYQNHFTYLLLQQLLEVVYSEMPASRWVLLCKQIMLAHTVTEGSVHAQKMFQNHFTYLLLQQLLDVMYSEMPASGWALLHKKIHTTAQSNWRFCQSSKNVSMKALYVSALTTASRSDVQ
jgi:hypothetical protein